VTANHDTHTRSDNSDPTTRVPNPDAQAILDYLDTVDSATVEGLAAKAQLPEAHLRDLLDDLQERDLVAVETGFRAVRVTATGVRLDDDSDDADAAESGESVATDGGMVQTVADALGADGTPSVDLTADQVWTLLASGRRRRFLRLLAVLHDPDQEYYLELRDLATALSTASHGTRVRESRHGEHHQTYVSLVETHVPMLEEYGLVEYYGRVKKLQAADEIVDVVRLMELVQRGCDRDGSLLEQEGRA